jgi:hypothetical protein
MKKKKSPLVEVATDKRKIGERCSVAAGSGLARAMRKAAADPRLQEYYRQQNKEWNL